MSNILKPFKWVIEKGGMLAFLLLIFVILAGVFNIVGVIVQGPVGTTPTVVSIFITLLIWIGLSQK